MPVQIYKVKCPYCGCGWIRRIELDIEGDTDSVVKGITEGISEFIAGFKKHQETDYWVDMPPCPNCERVYQYNAERGKTKK